MSFEELKKAIDELKEEVGSEEDLLKVFFLMYTKDELDLETLRKIVNYMGYEFTDEFEAMSEKDKKTKAWRKNNQPKNNK